MLRLDSFSIKLQAILSFFVLSLNAKDVLGYELWFFGIGVDPLAASPWLPSAPLALHLSGVCDEIIPAISTIQIQPTPFD